MPGIPQVSSCFLETDTLHEILTSMRRIRAASGVPTRKEETNCSKAGSWSSWVPLVSVLNTLEPKTRFYVRR